MEKKPRAIKDKRYEEKRSIAKISSVFREILMKSGDLANFCGRYLYKVPPRPFRRLKKSVKRVEVGCFCTCKVHPSKSKIRSICPVFAGSFIFSIVWESK